MKKQEIEILNYDELDVQELEQRLDMAIAGGVIVDSWACGVDCSTQCAAYCPTNCVADCSTFCVADTCGTDCGTFCSCNGNM
jgi:hypothetical protein